MEVSELFYRQVHITHSPREFNQKVRVRISAIPHIAISGRGQNKIMKLEMFGGDVTGENRCASAVQFDKQYRTPHRSHFRTYKSPPNGQHESAAETAAVPQYVKNSSCSIVPACLPAVLSETAEYETSIKSEKEELQRGSKLME